MKMASGRSGYVLLCRRLLHFKAENNSATSCACVADSGYGFSVERSGFPRFTVRYLSHAKRVASAARKPGDAVPTTLEIPTTVATYHVNPGLISPSSERDAGSAPQTIRRFCNFNSHTSRTHLCGTLRLINVDQPVELFGWVHNVRLRGRFLILRDWSGLVQVTGEDPDDHRHPTNKPMHKNQVRERVEDQRRFTDIFRTLPHESVLRVRGVVRARPEGQKNDSMPTGAVEIMATEVEVLSRAHNKLPFFVQHYQRVNEATRLKHRYIDLRNDWMQQILRIRSNFLQRAREFLHHQHGFVEVETPCLFRATPGGAQEFLVPTKEYGRFYTLPQSPQQFKQLLMVGGIDRYFQIARCFRDEGANPEKQPEFTQIDLEMSFCNGSSSIKRITEELLEYAWPSRELDDCLISKPNFPLKTFNYHDLISMYGSDRPDTRFGSIIHDITQHVGALELFQQEARRAAASGGGRKNDGFVFAFQGSSLKELKTPLDGGRANPYKLFLHASLFVHAQMPAVAQHITSNLRKQWKNDPRVRGNCRLISFVDVTASHTWGSSELSKHFSESIITRINQQLLCDAGSLIVIGSGYDRAKVLRDLGRLRVMLADYCENECGIKIRNVERDAQMFWVEHFPLFEYDADLKCWQSSHHPFTAPIPEHVDYLLQARSRDPSAQGLGRITGQHYDLVLNGQEVAGGSIRIHDAALQRYVLDLLQINGSGTVMSIGDSKNNEVNSTATLEHLLQALESGAPPHGGIAFGVDRLLLCMMPKLARSMKDVIAFPKSTSGADLMSGAPAKLNDEQLMPYHLKLIPNEKAATTAVDDLKEDNEVSANR